MPGPAYDLTVLDNCSDISGWTKANNASGRDVEESTAFVLNGTKSFRFYDTTRTSSILLEKAIAHAFVPDDRLGVIFYVDKHGVGDSSGISFAGGDNATWASGSRWQRLAIYTHTRGWNYHAVSFGDTTVLGGSPTIATNYIRMRVGLTTNAGFDRELYVDSIVRGRSRPKLIITFDDGKDSQYTEGFSYAGPRGVPLTLFVSGAFVGASNFLTAAQIREMQAAGCTIGAHAQSLYAWETPSNIGPDVDRVAQITGTRCRFGSWPNGRYGQTEQNFDAVQAAAQTAGLVGCRTIGSHPLAPWAFSPYYLPGGPNMQTGTTLQAVKDHIDKCIKHGVTAVIYGHMLAAAAASETWAIADWQSLIDYVVALRDRGLIDPVSLDEWWATPARASVGGTRA